MGTDLPGIESGAAVAGLSAPRRSLYAEHWHLQLWETAMARKKRKPSAGRRKKKALSAKRKSRPKVRRRPRRSLGDKVTGAYRTVVDTIKGTDRLRNKMEPPATSETE